MLRTSIPRLCWFVFCAYAVTGCSEGEVTAEPQPYEAAREFSQADKVAARALSISNTEVMATTESPYERALLCRHGLAEMSTLIREGWGSNSEQEQALQQAEAFFDQRLRDLAGADGKSPDDVQEDLEQTAQDNQDPAMNLRIVAGCLERLQQG